MENQTELLKALAEKLGTTSEYLWGVLLKQAPIDATITLFQYGLVAIYGLIIYRLHKRFSKSKGEYSSTAYYDNEGLPIAMVLSLVVFLCLIVVAICAFSDVINGFFNPEYWALDKILSSIKSK